MEPQKEAQAVLKEQMEKLKKLPYRRLTRYIGAMNAETYDVKGPGGAQYEVEVESSWLGEPEGPISVHVMVYEKWWKSFLPLTGSFVMRQDGKIEEG
jgi:hypothetical protein